MLFIKQFSDDEGETITAYNIGTGESVTVTTETVGECAIDDVMDFIDDHPGDAEAVISYMSAMIEGDSTIEDIRRELGIHIDDEGTVTVNGCVVPRSAAEVFSQMTSRQDGERFIRFIDRVMDNPRDYAREALISWVSHNKSLRILEDGRIQGYRGVREDLRSIHSGYGVVNGVEYSNAHLDNSPGNFIEYPVALTDHSLASCSYGLHVGTRDYAVNFGKRFVTVAFAPEDVISDINGTTYKVRVSAMEILREFTPGEEV